MRWLIDEIHQDRSLRLQLVVTGTHLSAAHGSTLKQIRIDGLKPSALIRMDLHDNSAEGVTRSYSKACAGFAGALKKLRPDLVVLLGDRYETFAAAAASMIASIPIAHIHGGERTEGLIDEAIRHAMTKMSHLHFVAHPEYRRRVVQLGEDPKRVFCFGSPGLDHLRRTTLLSRGEVERRLGLSKGRPYFLVTYHPVTLEPGTALKQARAILGALGGFRDHAVILTGANADAGGAAVNAYWRSRSEASPDRIRFFASLGSVGYLSAMKHCAAVVGNSSSGLLEAPALRKATVNIGDRQRGRLRSASVIDCRETKDAVSRAVRLALSNDFQKRLERVRAAYGGSKDASRHIKDVLKRADLGGILKKRFRDLPQGVRS